MTTLNASVAWSLALLLRPMSAWPPAASLSVVSLIVAAGLLVAFKLTSNQAALARTKRAAAAGLLELRLFQDDPRLVLRVVFDLILEQARYLRYALVPMVWVALPVTLLLAHLDAWYGREGLRVGATAVVTVKLAEAGASDARVRQMLALEAPAGVRVETPLVWVPALREAAWRVRAEREGDYALHVRWGETRVSRHVRVSPGLVSASIVRPAPRVWDVLLSPAETPLPADAPFEAIGVGYPVRAIDMFGVSFPWLVLFFILTVLFTLVGRRAVGVTI
jgi:hypothetical protein